MFIEKVSRREPCRLVQRTLDGGLIEGKYTGSYSTRRGGMITTGCPGSSLRTPGGQRGEKWRERKFKDCTKTTQWQLSPSLTWSFSKVRSWYPVERLQTSFPRLSKEARRNLYKIKIVKVNLMFSLKPKQEVKQGFRDCPQIATSG